MNHALKLLSRIGLTNSLHSYEEILDSEVIKINKVYCASNSCFSRQSFSKKGKLVYEGLNLIYICPSCNNPNYLYYDSITTRKSN